MRFEARDFFNENRQMAIALGKVFAEDIALKNNEKQILFEKHQKIEDKICEERQNRVKQTKNVFKIPKDQFKIRPADNRKEENEDISSKIHLEDDQKFID